MLNPFDWVRRARTGAEVLSTLRCFAEEPDLHKKLEVGPPPSALLHACERCRIYKPLSGKRFCAVCQAVLDRSWRLGNVSRHACILWGFVNQTPKQFRTGDGFQDSHMLGSLVPDERHFLVMLPRRDLKPWFQELAIYHGTNLKGIIQILPTIGFSSPDMGELLCRTVKHESRFPMDRLRVRFFSNPYHVFRPHEFDREGVLTFEVADFLSLLEMAAVFRTILPPDEQDILHRILDTDDPQKEKFYWGRFMGILDQEARDMLSAWNIRGWPKPQVQLLYDLMDYVVYYRTH
jgi:hypothetical protein